MTVLDKDAGAFHDMFSSTDDKLGECVVALSVLEGKQSHEFKEPLSPKGTIATGPPSTVVPIPRRSRHTRALCYRRIPMPARPAFATCVR